MAEITERVRRICLACNQESDVDPSVVACPIDGTSLITLVPTPDPLIGATINGKYVATRRFASAHNASLYLLEEELPNGEKRETSLYRLLSYQLEHQADSKKFAVRANSLMRMDNERITTYKDAGIDSEGRAYVITEFAEGNQIRPADVVIDTVRRSIYETAKALEYAHSNGVLHLQLHPGSVIVQNSGAIKLTGFYLDNTFPFLGSGLSCS